MTACERIRYLRKNILKISQESFAKKINISRSNLGNIEIGRINLTERVIHDICRIFIVNRDWLLNGKEPIFIEENDPFIHKFVDIYKSLNDDSKKCLQGYIYRLLEEQNIKK